MSRARLVAAIATLFLLAFSVASATDYHLDSVRGDDKNPGTADAPWQSLARANQGQFQAGDSLFLKGGRSFRGTLHLGPWNCSTSPDKPLTIASADGERATISAEGESGIVVQGVGHVIVQDLVVSGRPCGADLPGGGGNNGILIANDTTTLVRGVVIQRCEIHGFVRGVFLCVGEGPGIDDVVIDDVEVHGNQDAGIMALSGGVLPKDAHAGERTYPISNLRITRCLAWENRGIHGETVDDPPPTLFGEHNISGSGIVLLEVQDALIQDCVAHDNGGENPSPEGYWGGPLGIWAYGDRIVMQYNEVYGHRIHPSSPSDGGGFNLHGTNSVCQYNYSHDNDGLGFLIDSAEPSERYGNMTARSKGVVLRYNISQNDGARTGEGAIFLGGGMEGVYVYNNAVWTRASDTHAAPAIHLNVDSGDATTPDSRMKDVLVANNILAREGKGLLVQGIDPERMEGVLFLHNDYHDVEGDYAVVWGEVSISGEGADGIRSWASETGQETLEEGIVALTEDPGLTAPGEGGAMLPDHDLTELEAYRLLPGSALIDRGLDLVAWGVVGKGDTDFYRKPIPPAGGAFDIGAHELARGTPTLDERIAPILPSPEEELWLEVPWQQNVMLARLDAQRTGKPLAIWIMDGNVLGCT